MKRNLPKERKCGLCQQEKSIEEFKGKYGYAKRYCINCRAITEAREKQYHHDYMENYYHKQGNRRVAKLLAMPWVERVEEKTYQERDKWYRMTYGISLERRNAMEVEQNGLCAICGKPGTENEQLVLDHNHRTGAVRALLCIKCNSAIGLFDEDADLLERAITYLGRFNSWEGIG